MTYRFVLVIGCLVAAGAASAAEAPRPWKADANGDQRLSQSEYINDMARRVMKLDRNADGTIDKEERQAAMDDAANRARKRMERLLASEDQNSDGTITKAELDTILASRFTKLDADGDGLLAREDLSRRAAKPAAQSSSVMPN